MNTGIYRIRNKINGKCYVGSTAFSLYHRLKHHRNALKRQRHCNQHLQRAWDKYGSEIFVFEIIEFAPASECIEKEQWYIDNTPSQYNLCRRARSILGIKRSIETKNKLRNQKLGILNPMFGKIAPNACKVKLITLKTGEAQTFESIQRCANFLGLKNSRLKMILRGSNSDICLRKMGYQAYKG